MACYWIRVVIFTRPLLLSGPLLLGSNKKVKKLTLLLRNRYFRGGVTIGILRDVLNLIFHIMITPNIRSLG